jgi:transposase-like protein
MREPTEKPFDPVVSPVFINAMHEELRQYDGQRVGAERPCPNCESEALRKNGYQNEPKTVARLVTADGLADIGADVQQFQCSDCGHSFQGDLSDLFYEGCAYAKPVVDLCRFHAAESSASACTRTLRQQYGLLVTPETVTRYVDRFDDDVDAHTIDIGGYSYSLAFLSFLFSDDEDGDPHFVIQRSRAIW